VLAKGKTGESPFFDLAMVDLTLAVVAINERNLLPKSAAEVSSTRSRGRQASLTPR
jgi:hypothetical protein